jgi:hypothetical protein
MRCMCLRTTVKWILGFGCVGRTAEDRWMSKWVDDTILRVPRLCLPKLWLSTSWPPKLGPQSYGSQTLWLPRLQLQVFWLPNSLTLRFVTRKCYCSFHFWPHSRGRTHKLNTWVTTVPARHPGEWPRYFGFQVTILWLQMSCVTTPASPPQPWWCSNSGVEVSAPAMHNGILRLAKIRIGKFDNDASSNSRSQFAPYECSNSCSEAQCKSAR